MCKKQIYGETVILTNPGHASRQGEVDSVARILTQKNSEGKSVFGFTNIIDTRILAASDDIGVKGATLDGGDVMITGRHCFVGISSRTNIQGVEVLTRFLSSKLPSPSLPTSTTEGKTNSEKLYNVIGIKVLDDLHLKSIGNITD